MMPLTGSAASCRPTGSSGRAGRSVGHMATVIVRYIVNDVDEAITFYCNPVELFEPYS